MPVSERHGNVFNVHYFLSAVGNVLNAQVYLPYFVAPRLTDFPKLQEFPNAPLVACSARLYALSKPRLLLRELFVENGLVALAGGEKVVAAAHKIVESAIEGYEFSPVHFDNPIGKISQKSSVVRNEYQSFSASFQKFFEPQNGIDIEMVCRLVEQQDIRIRGELAAQKRAAFQTRGSRRDVEVGLDFEAFDKRKNLGVHTPRVDFVKLGNEGVEFRLFRLGMLFFDNQKKLFIARQKLARLAGALRHDGICGAGKAEGNVLRKISGAHVFQTFHAACVGLQKSRDNFQQRSFSAAVSSDKREGIGGLDIQIRAGQKRLHAILQSNIA